MALCPTCRCLVPPGVACPSCGGTANLEDEGTLSTLEDAATGSAPFGFTPSSLLPPGMVLLARYRIVFPVARGGMGEVYRADDLKLGHPVALKFLPEEVSSDPGVLERFHDEVRHARAIAHPNVCRVHDIGEVEGRHFLSMEYVDGEDLASLLRRIGRLPAAKAKDIARELCAGLAAAHAEGLVHRDLKPGNILIDGRGRARIADFGLAVRAGRPSPDVAGTPPYMAPELFLGRGPSVQSDIYALGTVFYELFTGRRPFAATGLSACRRAHLEEIPTPPSDHVADLDPAVERVILRCLEKQPADRPPSVRAVASALPGGDPLEAALAAGQTPPPDVVAAAGEAGVLATRTAATLLVAAIAGLVAFAGLSPRIFQYGVADATHPPSALARGAEDALRAAGSWTRPRYAVAQFHGEEGFADWRARPVKAPFATRERQSRRLGFLYRESPDPLAPYDLMGLVTSFDPPATSPGMATVELDPTGRLVWLLRVLHPRPSAETGAAPAFGPLFERAGLAGSTFVEDSPRFLPPTGFDRRFAWIEKDGPRRVEAASFGEEIVSFAVLPRDAEPASAHPSPDLLARIGSSAPSVLLLLALATGGLLAERNLRLHRGDRRGALRLAAFEVIALTSWWALRAHHVADLGHSWVSLTVGVGAALFWGTFLWVLYLALEPWIRRHSPAGLVSWARLVAGRVRDPLVGRDVLVGLALAGPMMVARASVELHLSPPSSHPSAASEALGNLTWTVAGLFWSVHTALFMTLTVLLLLHLLQMVVRRRDVAAALWVLVAMLPGLSGEHTVALRTAAEAFLVGVLLFALVRFGVLTAAVVIFAVQVPVRVPLTLDASAWYAGPSFLVLGLVVVFAVQAWRIATGAARRAH